MKHCVYLDEESGALDPSRPACGGAPRETGGTDEIAALMPLLGLLQAGFQPNPLEISSRNVYNPQ